MQSQAELPSKSFDLKLPSEKDSYKLEIREDDNVPYYDQLNLG